MVVVVELMYLPVMAEFQSLISLADEFPVMKNATMQSLPPG